MYPFQNVLPPQQVLQANGKASIDMIRMSPNSSVLILDSTAPLVWLCVSDSLGNVTSTPYDIFKHVDPEPVDVNSLDARLATIEKTLQEVINGKSNVNTVESIGDDAEFITNKAGLGNASKRKKSTGNASNDAE